MESIQSPFKKSNTTRQKAELPWLVIYTRPRQEKSLAIRLQKAGYNVYCPSQRTKKRWSDRWKWVDQPLFASHIFIQLDPECRHEVYFFPGFVRFIFWLKRPAIVNPKEIETLKKWLLDYPAEAFHIKAFERGEMVTLNSGPFLGHSGKILGKSKNGLEIILEELKMKVRIDLRLTEVNSK